MAQIGKDALQTELAQLELDALDIVEFFQHRKLVLSYFGVYAKGRLQLLLIHTIVLKSPCFILPYNRERTAVLPACGKCGICAR